MANIAITNVCNLNCPYCFANPITNQQSQFMTLKDFKKILEFIRSAKPFSPTVLGIIGGEPTLHPDFNDILTYLTAFCSSYNCMATIFTNGTNLLPYFTNFDNPFLSILLNYNNPKLYSNNLSDQILKVFERANNKKWFHTNKLRIGCNLYPTEQDYDFIWQAVKQYHISNLRVSIASPAASFSNYQYKKDEYFQFMKPIFLNFVQNAELNHCLLMLDCSKIPQCYFSDKEWQLIIKNCYNYNNLVCSPSIDFTINNQAISCFGNYFPIDFTKFATFNDLQRYFTYSNYIKISNNFTMTKCQNCEKKDLLLCQGGCLNFK